MTQKKKKKSEYPPYCVLKKKKVKLSQENEMFQRAFAFSYGYLQN